MAEFIVVVGGQIHPRYFTMDLSYTRFQYGDVFEYQGSLLRWLDGDFEINIYEKTGYVINH